MVPAGLSVGLKAGSSMGAALGLPTVGEVASTPISLFKNPAGAVAGASGVALFVLGLFLWLPLTFLMGAILSKVLGVSLESVDFTAGSRLGDFDDLNE
jgi:hypothetical protein